MEAALPLAALEREEDFALTVEVAIPLGVFGVAEMAPGVVVNALEPSETTLVARELVALDEGDKRFEVYPPEFLVELEFVTGLAQAIHEVEDAVVLTGTRTPLTRRRLSLMPYGVQVSSVQ